jgi:hypothetical protein
MQNILKIPFTGYIMGTLTSVSEHKANAFNIRSLREGYPTTTVVSSPENGNTSRFRNILISGAYISG